MRSSIVSIVPLTIGLLLMTSCVKDSPTSPPASPICGETISSIDKAYFFIWTALREDAPSDMNTISAMAATRLLMMDCFGTQEQSRLIQAWNTGTFTPTTVDLDTVASSIDSTEDSLQYIGQTYVVLKKSAPLTSNLLCAISGVKFILTVWYGGSTMNAIIEAWDELIAQGKV